MRHTSRCRGNTNNKSAKCESANKCQIKAYRCERIPPGLPKRAAILAAQLLDLKEEKEEKTRVYVGEKVKRGSCLLQLVTAVAAAAAAAVMVVVVVVLIMMND